MTLVCLLHINKCFCTYTVPVALTLVLFLDPALILNWCLCSLVVIYLGYQLQICIFIATSILCFLPTLDCIVPLLSSDTGDPTSDSGPGVSSHLFHTSVSFYKSSNNITAYNHWHSCNFLSSHPLLALSGMFEGRCKKIPSINSTLRHRTSL